jgi:hypothetical protein
MASPAFLTLTTTDALRPAVIVFGTSASPHRTRKPEPGSGDGAEAGSPFERHPAKQRITSRRRTPISSGGRKWA